MRNLIAATFVIAASSFISFAAVAQSCPANSHAVRSSDGQTICQCNSGYVMRGGQCVRA
jgi:hypothetical protein